jgi:hypothetical protein
MMTSRNDTDEVEQMKKDKELSFDISESTPEPEKGKEHSIPSTPSSPQPTHGKLHPLRPANRPRSRAQSVKDEGQAGASPSLATPTGDGRPITPTNLNLAAIPPGATLIGNTIIPASNLTTTRPTDSEGIAYPFKLKVRDTEEVRSGNASMMTLESEVRPISPLPDRMTKTVQGESAPATPLTNGSATPVLERPPGPERFETAKEIL